MDRLREYLVVLEGGSDSVGAWQQQTPVLSPVGAQDRVVHARHADADTTHTFLGVGVTHHA